MTDYSGNETPAQLLYEKLDRIGKLTGTDEPSEQLRQAARWLSAELERHGNVLAVAALASQIYFMQIADHIGDDILEALMLMEEGPEFEMPLSEVRGLIEKLEALAS